MNRLILGAIVVIVAIVVAVHVISAISTHSNPPVECYILGGHWDIWNGWRCG